MAAAGVPMAARATRPRPSSAPSQLARSAATPTCIRPSTDSLDSPTPSRCPTRRGPPLLRSWPEPRSGSQRTASPTSTGSSPTTGPATALETSPGSSDDARDIRRRSRTPRATTGKLSVTSESWPRNCSTPESSIASRPVIPRSPSGTSTTTTTARTAEPVGGRQHLDFGAASPTFSPHTEAAGVDIGIVTSIVGLGGGQVTFTGRQDHAGTTPMRQRLDPMPAAGAFLAQLPAIAAAAGDAAVLTCGLIEAEPGGTNVVPHQVTAHLDFRAPHPQALASLEQGIIEAASAAAEAHGVQSRYTRHSITRPVPLDPVLQDELHLSAKAQGLSTTTLPSGAGHDSQNMAQIAPTAMVFIPSRHGRSHSPAEHSSWAAIENGANVLLDVLLGLASAEAGRG